MAEGFQNPRMDWDSLNRGQSFKDFKQLAELWFIAKKVKKEEQYSYIILWSGKDGLRHYNTWQLTADQVKDPANIWTRLEEQVTPQENFRINRLELIRFAQVATESVDSFVTRCKEQAAKCRLHTTEQSDERIIETIIAGIKYSEVQKDLLR